MLAAGEIFSKQKVSISNVIEKMFWMLGVATKVLVTIDV